MKGRLRFDGNDLVTSPPSGASGWSKDPPASWLETVCATGPVFLQVTPAPGRIVTVWGTNTPSTTSITAGPGGAVGLNSIVPAMASLLK
jgi:hypothetical protein